MKRRAIIATIALTFSAAGGVAQESPIEILERLMQPPAEAIAETFRARAKPKAPAARAQAKLHDVPLPHLRPASPTPTPLLGYLPEGDAALVAGGEADPALAVIREAEPTTAAEREAEPLVMAVPAAEPTVAAVPSPRLRPGQPTADVAALPATALPPLDPLPPAARSTCDVSLAMLGVEATALAPINEERCGIAAPVAVAALDDGAVDFTAKAIVDCAVAETLATWLDGTVQPQAEKTLGGRVTGLRIAASYACRNRDGLADAKLSEHAKGNAIDISAFRIGGRWIEVGAGWQSSGADADFLRAVRTSACGPFTTVLGPGADAYHSDHFHLDLAKRRTAGPSKGLFCQ